MPQLGADAGTLFALALSMPGPFIAMAPKHHG